MQTIFSRSCLATAFGGHRADAPLRTQPFFERVCKRVHVSAGTAAARKGVAASTTKDATRHADAHAVCTHTTDAPLMHNAACAHPDGSAGFTILASYTLQSM